MEPKKFLTIESENLLWEIVTKFASKLSIFVAIFLSCKKEFFVCIRRLGSQPHENYANLQHLKKIFFLAFDLH